MLGKGFQGSEIAADRSLPVVAPNLIFHLTRPPPVTSCTFMCVCVCVSVCVSILFVRKHVGLAYVHMYVQWLLVYLVQLIFNDALFSYNIRN